MNSFRFFAPEYYQSPKAYDWYWSVGIIAFAAAAAAVIFGNFIFAALIVIATFTLVVYASRPPGENEIEISDRGVTVGKYRFSFSDMESFWIEHHDLPRLLIKINRVVMSHIVIPVGGLTETDKEELREFLRTKLPEEEQTEPLLEQIMERFGF